MRRKVREKKGMFWCDFICCNNILLHPALNWLFLGDTNRMIAEVWAVYMIVYSYLLLYMCGWEREREREREREMTPFTFLQTPMNMASTRSHCIFTIHISSREAGSDTVKKAKLHLVDLAGWVHKAKCTLLTVHVYSKISQINITESYIQM